MMKDLFSKIDWYKVTVDILIPLATFAIGLFVEKKWQVTNYFKTKLAQNTDGQNNSPLQVGINNGTINHNMPGSQPPIALPAEKNELAKKIEEVVKLPTSSFSAHYEEGYKYLHNGHIQLAASAFLSAFIQINDPICDESIYQDEVNKVFFQTIKDAISNLKDFSDNSESDKNQLVQTIEGIEKTITSIFGYLK